MPSFYGFSMQPDSPLRRGLRLEYATLFWNVMGSAVVVAVAVKAGSAALAGSGSIH